MSPQAVGSRRQPPTTAPTARSPRLTTPSPIPSYAPPAPHYADWSQRVGATLLDWAFLALALWVVTTLTDFSAALETLGWLAWLGLVGYIAWLNGSKGQSPGKALLGLKVVRDTDGSTLGGPEGLLRGLVLLVMVVCTGGLLGVLAVLWPVCGRRKQALHDKVLGAVVLAGYPRAKLGRAILRP